MAFREAFADAGFAPSPARAGRMPETIPPHSDRRDWRRADGFARRRGSPLPRTTTVDGGGSGIRTHGSRFRRTAVFKTAAINRSAIPPRTSSIAPVNPRDRCEASLVRMHLLYAFWCGGDGAFDPSCRDGLLLMSPAIARGQTWMVHGAAGPTVTDPGYSLAAGAGFSPTSRLTILFSAERTHLSSQFRTYPEGFTSAFRGGTLTLATGEMRFALLGRHRVGPYVLTGVAAGASRPNVTPHLSDPGDESSPRFVLRWWNSGPARRQVGGLHRCADDAGVRDGFR